MAWAASFFADALGRRQAESLQAVANNPDSALDKYNTWRKGSIVANATSADALSRSEFTSDEGQLERKTGSVVNLNSAAQEPVSYDDSFEDTANYVRQIVDMNAGQTFETKTGDEEGIDDDQFYTLRQIETQEEKEGNEDESVSEEPTPADDNPEDNDVDASPHRGRVSLQIMPIADPTVVLGGPVKQLAASTVKTSDLITAGEIKSRLARLQVRGRDLSARQSSIVKRIWFPTSKEILEDADQFLIGNYDSIYHYQCCADEIDNFRWCIDDVYTYAICVTARFVQLSGKPVDPDWKLISELRDCLAILPGILFPLFLLNPVIPPVATLKIWNGMLTVMRDAFRDSLWESQSDSSQRKPRHMWLNHIMACLCYIGSEAMHTFAASYLKPTESQKRVGWSRTQQVFCKWISMPFKPRTTVGYRSVEAAVGNKYRTPDVINQNTQTVPVVMKTLRKNVVEDVEYADETENTGELDAASVDNQSLRLYSDKPMPAVREPEDLRELVRRVSNVSREAISSIAVVETSTPNQNRTEAKEIPRAQEPQATGNTGASLSRNRPVVTGANAVPGLPSLAEWDVETNVPTDAVLGGTAGEESDIFAYDSAKPIVSVFTTQEQASAPTAPRAKPRFVEEKVDYSGFKDVLELDRDQVLDTIRKFDWSPNPDLPTRDFIIHVRATEEWSSETKFEWKAAVTDMLSHIHRRTCNVRHVMLHKRWLNKDETYGLPGIWVHTPINDPDGVLNNCHLIVVQEAPSWGLAQNAIGELTNVIKAVGRNFSPKSCTWMIKRWRGNNGVDPASSDFESVRLRGVDVIHLIYNVDQGMRHVAMVSQNSLKDFEICTTFEAQESFVNWRV